MSCCKSASRSRLWCFPGGFRRDRRFGDSPLERTGYELLGSAAKERSVPCAPSEFSALTPHGKAVRLSHRSANGQRLPASRRAVVRPFSPCKRRLARVWPRLSGEAYFEAMRMRFDGSGAAPRHFAIAPLLAVARPTSPIRPVVARFSQSKSLHGKECREPKRRKPAVRGRDTHY
jgi:hypothetical protein